ncbi:hypothetical protein SAMN06297468_1561 [Altererythrobacter xiamenensis]|uniref:Uncharacterized protein n=1 Tax=Altererythrobacter xiamenensis TaxID=1316679 RepID=A0A1Y6F9E3_9SPHN|nr:hypothetical protein SAMN06297468_1561 [Altererythrobacter xiamenensis]
MLEQFLEELAQQGHRQRRFTRLDHPVERHAIPLGQPSNRVIHDPIFEIFRDEPELAFVEIGFDQRVGDHVTAIEPQQLRIVDCDLASFGQFERAVFNPVLILPEVLEA